MYNARTVYGSLVQASSYPPGNYGATAEERFHVQKGYKARRPATGRDERRPTASVCLVLERSSGRRRRVKALLVVRITPQAPPEATEWTTKSHLLIRYVALFIPLRTELPSRICTRTWGCKLGLRLGGAMTRGYRRPVALAVRQIVAQVGPGQADTLAVLEAAGVVPDDFLVAEARPAVCVAFPQKVIQASSHRRLKERLPADRVVERDRLWEWGRRDPKVTRSAQIDEGTRARALLCRRLLPVARVLSEVAIEAADPIRDREVAATDAVIVFRWFGWFVQLSFDAMTSATSYPQRRFCCGA
eukprot:scaffold526_cov230-Pinguiococcus_pyrenoidosus.AAC.1